MKLQALQQQWLDGELGELRRKLMLTLVRFGEIMDAEALVPLEGPGHLVIADSQPGIGAPIALLEEMIEAGLKSEFPFSVDPGLPYDEAVIGKNEQQFAALKNDFPLEIHYRECLVKLGLSDLSAFTCTPWFEQVGNRPSAGQVIAWAESSAIVYANSVLGARTHRNPGIIDLISNVLGLTPGGGLVSDSGRQPTCRVHLDLDKRPDPQALGVLIGEYALDGIPWITGLTRHLGSDLNGMGRRFLHQLGTNASLTGAVGLFHVEGLTPEARMPGLINHDHLPEGLVLTDEQVKDKQALLHEPAIKLVDPDLCVIGCPHLMLGELELWWERISAGLEGSGQERLAVKTLLVAAPDVVRAFDDGSKLLKFLRQGVQVSSFCLEALIHNQHTAPVHAVTNSNKLRFYGANVSCLDDDALLKVMLTGKML
jgi:predicted aconitase